MNAPEPLAHADPEVFRRVMGRFATGVTVIVAEAAGEIRGMTANAFMSGSLEPPLCVVSIARRARMHAHLAAARRFSVSILAAGQEELATHFAGRPVAGLDVAFDTAGGLAAIGGAAAVVGAEVAARHDCGDHTIHIGRILSMTARDRPPLVYHAGRFAALVPLREEGPELPEFW